MAERAPDLPPWADAAFLRDVQYADDRNLAARQSIYAYCERPADLPALVIDSLHLASDDAVVDVGCGNGLYLAELARRGHAGPLAAVDLSPGMLGAARRRAPEARLLVGDAARLPMRDAASDVTLAMHMLYHVPEPEDVVGELRRVTRPGGRVVIGLNALGHLGELRALINAELSAAGQSHVVRDRIWIDDAEVMLRRAFGSVTRHDLAGKLRLPDARPAADYVRSLGVARQPADLEWLVAAVTSRMDFGADGVFTVSTHCGWLICS